MVVVVGITHICLVSPHKPRDGPVRPRVRLEEEDVDGHGVHERVHDTCQPQVDARLLIQQGGETQNINTSGKKAENTKSADAHLADVQVKQHKWDEVVPRPGQITTATRQSVYVCEVGGDTRELELTRPRATE